MTKRTTIAEIAKQVGLSPSTVSRILKGESKSARGRENRERVMTTARQMGYLSPDIACVGLLSHTSYSPHLQATLRGINQTLFSRPIYLATEELPGLEDCAPDYVPHLLKDLTPQGLFFDHQLSLPEATGDYLAHTGTPIVYLNSKLDANCVHPDDLRGAYNATRHLLGLGHSQIGFLSFCPSEEYSKYDRLEGYVNAMTESQNRPLYYHQAISYDYHHTSKDDRFDVSRSILASSDRPTAIVTYSARECFPLIMAAFSLGMQIPYDLSIITFNSGPFTESGLRVTTFDLNSEEVGQRATDMLIKRLDTGIDMPLELVPCQFYEGQTCAPPVKLDE